jgi:hypothetical protein
MDAARPAPVPAVTGLRYTGPLYAHLDLAIPDQASTSAQVAPGVLV